MTKKNKQNLNRYTADNNVVTIHDRKSLRPAKQPSKYAETTDIPEIVYFIMSDGTKLSIDTRQDITIGRKARENDPDVTIDLEDYDGHAQGVSRQHCMMKVFKGYFTLVDTGSSNGTFINGERAIAAKRYAIYDEDEITFGTLSVRVSFYL